MAQYNEILEGGLNNLIIKRLGMQVGTAVPAVSPEMTMDLTLENDRVEWGFLKGEYRYGHGSASSAPGAGLHAALTIENPVDSGVLAVIERCTSTAFAAYHLVTGYTFTSVAFATGTFADTRQPVNSRCGARRVTITTANLPSVLAYLPNVVDNQGIIVPPGAFFIISCTAAATAITHSVMWRERPLLTNELG